MTSLLRKSAAATAGAAMFAFALASFTPAIDAQEAPAARSKTRAKTSKKAPPRTAEDDEPDVPRRVPMYFGGLGLSNDQKESIYAVEAKYQPQIQELERKADDLRDRLMSECEDVLTAAQKKALAEVRQSASDRRKSASARRKAEAEAQAAPDAPEKPAAKKKAESTAKKAVSAE